MRTAEIKRKTRETDIEVFVDLDGSGKVDIDTGIGFFDHMLTAFGVHSGIDLKVKCEGDLYVDAHHSVEDTGICIGKALPKHWEIRAVSPDTALLMCQWMKHLVSVRWISAADLFWYSMPNSMMIAADSMTTALLKNFFELLLSMQG